MSLDYDAFSKTRHHAVEALLAERNAAGHWTGELSSSALSTATALTALSLIDRARGCHDHHDLIHRGAAWLIDHQNADGGWGDTTLSFSNISTTTLCWAALALPEAQHDRAEPARRRARQWLTDHAGSDTVDALVEAIMQRYGVDRTFSVPILTMSALCGCLGDESAAWRRVKQLPFELAALPQSWFRLLNLRVVSYALPALIAIGQVRHHNRPTRNPITRIARNATRQRTLSVLEAIQPDGGGFLEATPLTSFVTMSLAGADLADHPVARQGVQFLEASARTDGSWPIDTNLATWLTTLSINALAAGGCLNQHLSTDHRTAVRDWLLNQQYREVHPFTGAAPGGWAWTDLPGGVPDADDTSGALIALHHLGADHEPTRRTATAGIRWLVDLQNRDGGIPTFCHGWGKLPFDRSSQDITAHFLLAAEHWGAPASAVQQATAYLQSQQRSDGAWTPLWFGNQHHGDELNLTYGTTRVLPAMARHPAAGAAVDWLIQSQNADGGWGGAAGAPSSIEETALALDALATGNAPQTHPAIERGVAWLCDTTRHGTAFPPAPIGFYFAKLWYYEKLYPLIFTVGALERLAARLNADLPSTFVQTAE